MQVAEPEVEPTEHEPAQGQASELSVPIGSLRTVPLPRFS